ncbi:Zinc knuckle CX2CX4HX4C [Trema orientale]|uniref:Zinc knuckle CX2CX4HX4C n=1 Tax=Trema orientale TaxID=63057 RepID=A0A2P5FJY8_TREOI|nr:Zinc knuckle CX2CX4HX4C [Trema orientale]
MRVRVKIDIREPFKWGMRIFVEDKNEYVSLMFQYERLLDFCFHCGIIGHRAREFPSIGDEEEAKGTPSFRYSNWIKAAPPNFRSFSFKSDRKFGEDVSTQNKRSVPTSKLNLEDNFDGHDGESDRESRPHNGEIREFKEEQALISMGVKRWKDLINEKGLDEARKAVEEFYKSTASMSRHELLGNYDKDTAVGLEAIGVDGTDSSRAVENRAEEGTKQGAIPFSEEDTRSLGMIFKEKLSAKKVETTKGRSQLGSVSKKSSPLKLGLGPSPRHSLLKKACSPTQKKGKNRNLFLDSQKDVDLVRSKGPKRKLLDNLEGEKVSEASGKRLKSKWGVDFQSEATSSAQQSHRKL